MLATRSPQMRKAVGVLKKLSADERTRMLFEKQETARRDMESRLKDAIAEKDAVIAEREAEIAERKAEIAEKDSALAEKNAENERLRQELAKLLTEQNKK